MPLAPCLASATTRDRKSPFVTDELLHPEEADAIVAVLTLAPAGAPLPYRLKPFSVRSSHPSNKAWAYRFIDSGRSYL